MAQVRTMQSVPPKQTPDADARSTAAALNLAFAVLAAGILLAGHAYYRRYEIQYRTQVERQLSAIADLKVSQLVQWRGERLGDGETMRTNPVFAGLVRRILANPGDASARQALQAWLQPFYSYYAYERLSIRDAQGVERIAVPGPVQPGAADDYERACADAGLGQAVLADLHRDRPDRPPHMAVLVPLRDEASAGRSFATVVMRIDPTKYLYPFVSAWPTPSDTAETLLVRREGDQAVFLNDLRFQKGTALSLRFPLTQTEVPAVRAVLGQQGIVEGRDYRGVPVVGYVRPVPDSPWFIVARMDSAEVYAPLRERLWGVVVLVLALLGGAGASVRLVWRQQQRRYDAELVSAAIELRDSEAKFRSLYATVAEGIALHQVVYDEHGEAVDYRLVDCNPAYQAHTGIVPEQVIGQLASVVYGVTPAPYLVEYARVAETGEPYAFETHFAPLERDFHISVTSPRTGFFATVFEDITDRLKRQRELQETNAQLESFTYTISHDLRSPLVTVQTFLGYLEQDLGTGDAARIATDIGYVRTAAHKMEKLLDELLDMSRLGRVTHTPSQVRFSELVDEALGAVAGAIVERGVEVQVSEDDLVLVGDRRRLVQVWQNLIENSVKYGGDAPAPRIQIGISRAGPDIVFNVCDNGIGVDARYRERVFGLFEKLDSGTPGTGLGLALVRRIVELNGGRIWLDSPGLGQGTCVRFTLPGAVKDTRQGAAL